MSEQEIDRIECAIRHIQTSTDIDPWAMEIAVEAMQKQIDHIADSGKKAERAAESAQNVQDEDLIFRNAAIDALHEQIEQCNEALGSFDISLKDEYAIKVERASLKAYKEQLENLPSAQPELIEKAAYIRGFEQGRTQGMIDSQGGRK